MKINHSKTAGYGPQVDATITLPERSCHVVRLTIYEAGGAQIRINQVVRSCLEEDGNGHSLCDLKGFASPDYENGEDRYEILFSFEISNLDKVKQVVEAHRPGRWVEDPFQEPVPANG